MPSRTRPEREPADLALDWARSTLARTVALKIVPWMLPTIGILLAWLQDAIGLNLDPEVVATAVGAGIIGAAGVVLQWVRNHGKGATQLAETLLMTEPKPTLDVTHPPDPMGTRLSTDPMERP